MFFKLTLSDDPKNHSRADFSFEAGAVLIFLQTFLCQDKKVSGVGAKPL